MSLGMDLASLSRRLEARSGRLPFEIGAYVALEVCERLLEGPAMLDPEDVRVAPDGVVSVYALPGSADGASAARSVAAILAQLLVAAGGNVPPALLRLVDEGPSGGQWSLSRLRDELEATLVPLNRSAARRVLARMVRDLSKDPAPSLRPPPAPPASTPDAQPGSLDDELDALLEAPAPAPPAPAHDPDEEVAALFEALEGEVAGLPSVPPDAATPDPAAPGAAKPGAVSPEQVSPAAVSPEPVTPAAVSPHDRVTTPTPEGRESTSRVALLAELEGRDAEAGVLAPRPSAPGREVGAAAAGSRSLPDLDGFEDAPAAAGGGRGKLLVAGLLALIVAGGLGVWRLRPDVADGMLQRAERPDPEAQRQEAAEAEAQQREAAVAARDARYGTLVVRARAAEGTDAALDARAQILLFVGRGPAMAENLPVGRAHELVAVAPAGGVTRSVVPADATWPLMEGTPQYELAMQVAPTASPELGPTQLPQGAMGEATGRLGRVRVVTNPPGAKVYLLVGFGEARIDDLLATEAHELLVVPEGGAPERVVVGPSDWREGPGGKRLAEFDVVPRR